MRKWSKTALLGAGLTLAVFAAGCGSSGYYDDAGYYHRGYHDSYYGDRYRDSDSSERVRVCDADGDDCHWEYRRR